MNVIAWPTTPLGPLWGQLDAAGQLTALHWGAPPANVGLFPAHLHPATAWLEAYFHPESDRNPPETSPKFWRFSVGTPFQRRVWEALQKIPFGSTVTYGKLAQILQTSPRAVGRAVGANPLPIFYPCHRVVGSGSKLTGFSAPGGLETKRWLLNHEGVQTS